MEQIRREVNARAPLGSGFRRSPLHSLKDDGIVVAEVSWDGDMAKPVRWPFALRPHLGDEGVAALLAAQKEWKDDVLTTATDRFERRLAEECALLRVEMAALRAETSTQIKGTEALLRQDFAAGRADMFRWSFVFWIGQVGTIAAIFFARG